MQPTALRSHRFCTAEFPTEIPQVRVRGDVPHKKLLGQAGKNRWEQADSRDIQEWMQWLLSRGSDSYASNQFRALQQFFRWLAAEEGLPSLVTGLRPPHVADKPIPVFTGRELAGIERACVAAPVPAPLQPYLAGPRRPGRRPDGTQRLVLPADAPPLRGQRPCRPRPPDL
jgi:hypothetical protein